MKKTLFVSLMLLAAPMTFAATLPGFDGSIDFEGIYDLVEAKNEVKAVCYDRIIIQTEDDGKLSLYRDTTSYMPIISAELNGPARKVSGSHGEGMSQYAGTETATLKKKVLTFQYKARVNFAGIPMGTESDTFSYEWSQDGKFLKGIRQTTEGLSFGKKPTALCAYAKR